MHLIFMERPEPISKNDYRSSTHNYSQGLCFEWEYARIWLDGDSISNS